MGKWSKHYKGPEAKQKLAGQQKPAQAQPQAGRSNIVINTRNAIPHGDICRQIEQNQALMNHWIRPCLMHDEQAVVVSAGPLLIAEEVRKEQAAGRKIVAVKNALTPLAKAGIKPWACILLDPRPHVADFVRDADNSVIWFVASQVHPEVTKILLQRGCKIWGYHAPVGAGEDKLTALQAGAIVHGGSATATRGLYVLNHLGFKRFKLYGYDLCVPDKPDLNARDEMGQPKYFEISVGMNDPLFNQKRLFFSEGQLIAQFEEMRVLIQENRFEFEAVGDGIVPFLIKAKEISDLRRKEARDKLVGPNPPDYTEMLSA